MKKKVSLLIVLFVHSICLFSQTGTINDANTEGILVGTEGTTNDNGKNDKFRAHGKPKIGIFSNFHSTVQDGKTISAFELTRAYLGYEHTFSENFSGKVIFNVGNPGGGNMRWQPM